MTHGTTTNNSTIIRITNIQNSGDMLPRHLIRLSRLFEPRYVLSGRPWLVCGPPDVPRISAGTVSSRHQKFPRFSTAGVRTPVDSAFRPTDGLKASGDVRAGSGIVGD